MRDSKGRYMKGNDRTRHRFTHDECVAGFWAALESIVRRYPNWVDSKGRHMSVYFMKWRYR